MSEQNSPVARGIDPAANNFDTITSHDWHDPSKWSATDNSEWFITPSAGEVIVLTGVMIKFTHGMDIPLASKMTLDGIFADGVDPYPITEYDSVGALIRRGDKEEFINLSDPGEGAPFRRSIIKLTYEFSRHIFLWDSAGLTGEAPPNHLYVDALGIPKFKKLRVKIADNEPYKYFNDTGDSTLEIACSRYFATRYNDPGN